MQIPQRRGAPQRQECSQDQRLNGFLLGISSPTTSSTSLSRVVKKETAPCSPTLKPPCLIVAVSFLKSQFSQGGSFDP